MKKFFGTLAAVLTLSFAGSAFADGARQDIRECRKQCRVEAAKCMKSGKDRKECKKERRECRKACWEKHGPKR